jgi:CRP-like cAMP-binding protein
MAFIFDTDQRTATAIANTPAKLLRIHSAEFKKFAESDYQSAYLLIRNIAQTIAKRLRKTNQDVIKLTTVLSVALSKATPKG